MAAPDEKSLVDFASWCALQTVAAQRRFDDASLESVAGIAPARWRIATFEVRADLGVTVSRTTAFAIQVSPINLGFRIAHRHTAEADLCLTLTVDQRSLAPSGSHPS